MRGKAKELLMTLKDLVGDLDYKLIVEQSDKHEEILVILTRISTITSKLELEVGRLSFVELPRKR